MGCWWVLYQVSYQDNSADLQHNTKENLKHSSMAQYTLAQIALGKQVSI